jgi:colanic acid biosynthesis glycosyl transferase WcaI
MKILVYSINYAPELIGCAKYTTEMCEWLQAQGHEVRVITAIPYYPDWRPFAGYKSYQYKHEIINGVNILHCPLWIPQQPSGIKRILHLLSFGFSSFWPLLGQIHWKPAIIFFTEPTVFAFPGAILLSKLTNSRTILHVQDFEIDAAFNLQLLKTTFIRKIICAIETFLMKQCTFISTISQNMWQKLRGKNIAESKILLFPNWVNLDQIKPIAKSNSLLRQQLNIASDTIVCLYAGNIGQKQGLEVIINAATQLLTNKNIIFIICGTGPHKNDLQQKAIAKNLTNIIWLPLQPSNNLNNLLNVADIHLLPQQQAITDLVLPSKLSNMLASGRPIITLAKNGSELSNIVKIAGIVVNPDKPDDFSDAITLLANNNKQRLLLGIKAREYAELYLDKNVILKNFWVNCTTIAN